MVETHGISIAVLNSVVSAMCDPLRKYLTKFMDPFTLVATRGLIQAPIFCIWAIIDCGGKLPHLNHLFWTAVCVSGLINIVTSYLYNRSIQISTLSATVPFLSFTPAFLVVVAFVLLGEMPTTWGIIGISLAVLGGYWLLGSKADHISKGDTVSNFNVSQGSTYMILVAFLWSVSNAFDKIGVQNSSPLVFGAAIQIIVAVGSYVLQRLRIGTYELMQPIGMEQRIPWPYVVLAGVTSVISYYINLVATQNLEVSYVIAIKRSGCIWSVLLGKLFFKERNLRQKIPSILLMVVGVMCIVLGRQ